MNVINAASLFRCKESECTSPISETVFYEAILKPFYESLGIVHSTLDSLLIFAVIRYAFNLYNQSATSEKSTYLLVDENGNQ